MGTQLTDVGGKRDLWLRVCGEYLEMPGLRLTAPQACRLWGTDLASSLAVLEGLVDVAFLRRSDGVYMRTDSDDVTR